LTPFTKEFAIKGPQNKIEKRHVVKAGLGLIAARHQSRGDIAVVSEIPSTKYWIGIATLRKK